MIFVCRLVNSLVLTVLIIGTFAYGINFDQPPDLFKSFLTIMLFVLFFADVIIRKKGSRSDFIFSGTWITWYLIQLFLVRDLFQNGVPPPPDNFVFWMGIAIYVLPLLVNVLQLLFIKKRTE